MPGRGWRYRGGGGGGEGSGGFEEGNYDGAMGEALVGVAESITAATVQWWRRAVRRLGQRRQWERRQLWMGRSSRPGRRTGAR